MQFILNQMLFLIFTIFSQYQWAFYLQLGYFISLQFIREIKWKKELCRESLFPCGKWDFSTRKKAFSREGLFPLEIQVNCIEQSPTAKEGVAPAIAGDLLIKMRLCKPLYNCALIGSCSGPIALLKSRAKRWLVGVLSRFKALESRLVKLQV